MSNSFQSLQTPNEILGKKVIGTKLPYVLFPVYLIFSNRVFLKIIAALKYNGTPNPPNKFAISNFLVFQFVGNLSPHWPVSVVVDQAGDEGEEGRPVEEDVEHVKGVRVLKVVKIIIALIR
jgi:hypothetical protein